MYDEDGCNTVNGPCQPWYCFDEPDSTGCPL
jgi:hypothetical protein